MPCIIRENICIQIILRPGLTQMNFAKLFQLFAILCYRHFAAACRTGYLRAVNCRFVIAQSLTVYNLLPVKPVHIDFCRTVVFTGCQHRITEPGIIVGVIAFAEILKLL